MYDICGNIEKNQEEQVLLWRFLDCMSLREACCCSTNNPAFGREGTKGTEGIKGMMRLGGAVGITGIIFVYGIIYFRRITGIPSICFELATSLYSSQ